jgi:hypothetical protein
VAACCSGVFPALNRASINSHQANSSTCIPGCPLARRIAASTIRPSVSYNRCTLGVREARFLSRRALADQVRGRLAIKTSAHGGLVKRKNHRLTRRRKLSHLAACHDRILLSRRSIPFTFPLGNARLSFCPYRVFVTLIADGLGLSFRL